MFDTMTLTKVTGAICGSLLVYLFATWASDELYATAPAAHGDEEVAQAYTIDTGAEEASAEVAEEGPAFADLYAAADAAAGVRHYDHAFPDGQLAPAKFLGIPPARC